MCCEYLSEQSYWWTPVAVRNVMVLERLLVVIARSHGVRILHMPTTARACDHLRLCSRRDARPSRLRGLSTSGHTAVYDYLSDNLDVDTWVAPTGGSSGRWQPVVVHWRVGLVGSVMV